MKLQMKKDLHDIDCPHCGANLTLILEGVERYAPISHLGGYAKCPNCDTDVYVKTEVSFLGEIF